MLMMFFFLCFCCADCLKISVKQKWNWRLAENEQNKITAEMLIVNTPSEGSNDTYPLLLMLLLLYLLGCCCVCCLKIILKRKLNWSLADNGRNKRTAEAIIVNTPAGYRTSPTLWCFYCFCSLFCSVVAENVSTKTFTLNF